MTHQQNKKDKKLPIRIDEKPQAHLSHTNASKTFNKSQLTYLPPQNQEREKNNFGVLTLFLGFVFLFMYLIQISKKERNQEQYSSVAPTEVRPNEALPKNDFTGLQISKQRLEVEAYKLQEKADYQTQKLNRLKARDVVTDELGLAPEKINENFNRNSDKKDDLAYPDVQVPIQLQKEHESLEKNKKIVQQRKKVFIENLARQAEKQGLELKYDQKSGDVIIDQPQQREEYDNLGIGGSQ